MYQLGKIIWSATSDKAITSGQHFAALMTISDETSDALNFDGLEKLNRI